MSEKPVTVDEFLSARKDFVKSGDILLKANRSPSTWDPEKRTVRFVMSAEVEDRDRDIILQAGLGIDEFLKNPVALMMHNSRTFPAGTWSDLEKLLNGRPKRTEGTLNVTPEGVDEDADRLARHFGVGTIRACSIGFVPKTVVKREIPEDKREAGYYWPGYEIREAELVECSPVTIPANPAALAKMAQDGIGFASELIETVLDTWAKHPQTGLLVPRAEFEAAYKQATGERTSVITPPSPEGAGNSDAPVGPREHSILRRTLDYLFRAENEAKIVAATQAAAADLEREAAEEAARKEAEAREIAELEAEAKAAEERLVSKGIWHSAA